MNGDHLMGWPAALLCVEQESNGEAAQKRARKQFWEASLRVLRERPPAAWLEFERKKFEAEQAAKPVNRELQVGDLVFVTEENNWVQVSAVCRVEEISHFLVRLAHSEADTKKCNALSVSDEAKAMGFTKSWWLHWESVTLTRE